MKRVNITCGDNYWSIELPEIFNEKIEEGNCGEHVFWTNINDLTLRITPWHFERSVEGNVVFAPVEELKHIFMESAIKALFNTDEECDVDDRLLENLSDFEKVAYKRVFWDESDGKETYHICIGIFKVGEMLSFNIFGTDESECKDALKHLRTLAFSGRQ